MDQENLEGELTSEVARCPVCGAGKYRRLGRPGHPIGEAVFGPYLPRMGVCRCPCGLDFTNPRPATLLLKRFYEGRVYNAADVHSSAGAHRNAQSLLRAIPS